MNQKPTSLLERNSIFAWIAMATGLILLIPLVAMQFTTEVNWDAPDFLVAGLILLGAGSLFVLSARMVPNKHRFVLGTVFVAAVAYIWAELAVGIFTNLGS